MKLRRDAASSEGLLAPLAAIARLKRSPLDVTPAELGVACEQVATWAVENEHARTAIEWAEAGARADPGNPRLANLAGRLNRNAHAWERAETWFRRGIGFGREQNNVVERVWGHLGYGKLCQELGRVRSAREHINRGSRLAWRNGPPSLAASAQHDLCFMLTVHGHRAEAAMRGRRALAWYPKSHHRLPFFAADIALMLVLDGRFSAAVRVLRTVLRVVEDPTARVTILALIARAFAGAGEPEEWAVHRHRALKALEKHRGMEPTVRWHLAEGQRLAGSWALAEEEASATLAIAVAQGDREIERLTATLLRLVAARDQTSARQISTVEARLLVQELVERIAAWSPRRGRQLPGPWGATRAA